MCAYERICTLSGSERCLYTSPLLLVVVAFMVALVLLL